MKRTISLLSTLAFVIAFSGSAFAQAGSATVTASAELVSQLTVSSSSNLNFGKIPTAVSSVSIAPDQSGTATFNNTGTGESQGTVTISSGGSAQTVDVTVTNPTELDGQTGGNTDTIGFTGDHVGRDNTDLSSGTSSVTTADPNTDSTFDYVIYLGGSLADGTYTADTYNADITVDVDYQ